MANFECKVYRIESVENHPDADRLSLVKFKGFTCIANKLEDGSPRYQEDDLVVYIPEQALLPQWMMVKLGLWDEERLKGKLAGNEGNRCKAIRLRGIYSEGILYPIMMYQKFVDMDNADILFKNMLSYADPKREYKVDTWTEVHEGDNVAEILGVTKYEPPIPQHMAGECFNAGDIFFHYDIESIMKHPDVLKEGEEVRITEKIHGTQTRIQFCLNKHDDKDECFIWNDKLYIYIASKGLGDQGICFKDVPNNDNNVYVKIFRENFTNDMMNDIYNFMIDSKDCETPITDMTFYGETFGNTQDLHYGIKSNEPNKLNIFDISYGKKFVRGHDVHNWCKLLGLSQVPVLYIGPYSLSKVKELTDGKSIYDENQIREGCVITPMIERYDNEIGRVILKSVSEAYKLRKNGTEFN